MRALLLLAAMGMFPGLAFAEISTSNIGAGEPLSIARDDAGVTALVNTLEGLMVRRTTPDGGWGEPGALSAVPADNAALAAYAFVAHAAWVVDGIAMHQIVSDGVPQGEPVSLGPAAGSVSLVVDESGIAWILGGLPATLWSVALDGTLATHLPPGLADGAQLLFTPAGLEVMGSLGTNVFTAGFDGTDWAAAAPLGAGALEGACFAGGARHVLVSSPADGSRTVWTGVGSGWTSELVTESAGALRIACDDAGSFLVYVDEAGSIRVHSNELMETVAVVMVAKDAVTGVGGGPGGLEVIASAFGAGYHAMYDGELTGVPFLAGMDPAAPVAGTTVEVLGGRFVAGATSVLLDGDPLFVSDVTPWRLNALIPDDLQGGDHNLTILTSGGSDLSTVLILAPPPVVSGVSPTVALLDSLVVVEGDHLEQATGVTIAGWEQELLSADPAAVVFRVVGETPLGSGPLVVTTPSGTATSAISVLLPAPDVTQLSPNPAVPGGLLTITGHYLVNPTLVTVGGAGQTILSAENTSVTVLLDVELALGDHMVQVIADGGTCGPTGPLQIVEPPPEMPVIEELYPPNVSPGHEFLVLGKHLVTVHAATVNGVGATLVEAGEKSVRLRVSDALSAGETTLVLSSSKGTVQTGILLLEPGLPMQSLAGASPQPVEWGNALWLSGSGLESVWNVRIGHVDAEILSAENDLMQVLVSEDTVGGLQEVLVVGAGVSNGIEVLIALEDPPADVVEPDPETDASESDADESGSDADGGEEDGMETGASGGGDGGCRASIPVGGRASMVLWSLLLFAWMRRTSRGVSAR